MPVGHIGVPSPSDGGESVKTPDHPSGSSSGISTKPSSHALPVSVVAVSLLSSDEVVADVVGELVASPVSGSLVLLSSSLVDDEVVLVGAESLATDVLGAESPCVDSPSDDSTSPSEKHASGASRTSQAKRDTAITIQDAGAPGRLHPKICDASARAVHGRWKICTTLPSGSVHS